MQSFIISVVIFIGLFIVMVGLRNYMYKKVLETFDNRDFETFNKYIESFWAHYFINKYVRHLLILEAYIIQNQSNRAFNEMHIILRLKLTLDQQREVLGMCFYYFLSVNEKEYTRKTLEYTAKVKNDAMYQDFKLLYDVLILKQDNHLEECIDLLKSSNNEMLNFLIGLQYYYRKDKQNAKNYFEKAKEDLKQTNYIEVINKLLGEMQ